MPSITAPGSEPPPRGPADAVRIGAWRVDPSADEIAADGRVVKLEPLQMKLLLALAERPGQVVPTQDLLDTVWRDLVVTPNSVYQAVAQLRRQLGDSADEPAYIQTVHRKGYRLVAPVAAEPVAPPASEPPPAPAPAPAVSPWRARRLLLGASALAAMGAIGGGVAFWRARTAGRAGVPRLAVLPFADRSAGATEQALARGLAQDVAQALGRRDDLHVVAPDVLLDRNLDTAASDADTARRLGVQYLLHGELSRSGAALRVLARLHAPPRGEPVWQQTFEQPIGAAAQLPIAIAQQVGGTLALRPGAAPTGGTGPSEAYELYVLGIDAWRPKTPEALAKARSYFQRGIELDPAYARNYIGLGWTWIGQANFGAGLDMPRAVALATPLFERALRLDPTSPDALTGQALLHRFAGEHDRARELLRSALASNPNYVQAQVMLGIVESDSGWPLRAIPHFERATVLNPLSASPPERLALAQVFAGRLDAASISARRAIALEPAHPSGHWMLGVAGYAGGDLVQAVGGYRQALEREPRRPFLWYDLARLYLDLELPQAAAGAFARCVELLPGLAWPALHAAFAWVAATPRGSVPAVLAKAPDDGSVVEWALMRAMAGLAVDGAVLQRALDATAARGETLTPEPWFVFQGNHRLLDLATVQSMPGASTAAAHHLSAVQSQLDALERQGNRWHMLAFHRARVLALRGQTRPALDALAAAVAAGARRGWWLRLDPAFAGLRAQPRFAALLGDLSARVAAQRRQLGL
jgi:DNA-binding winged helix-turn-helix (wHTH) protein/TolB-like protein